MKPLKAFLAIILLVSSCTSTYAQKYVWAKKTGAVTSEVKTLKDGSFYTAGTFYKSLNIGDTVFNLPFPGSGMFFAKYSPTGALLKVIHSIGYDYQKIEAMDVDEQENVYLLTRQGYNVAFGPDSIKAPPKKVSYDLFYIVTKFDSTGHIRWSRQLHEPNQHYSGTKIFGYDLALGKDDELFLTGIANAYWIDSIYLNRYGYGGFLVRLDTANGKIMWSEDIIRTYYPELNVDDSSNVYISGDISLGSSYALFGTDTLHDAGQKNYLAKYDASGNYKWSTQVGDTQCNGVMHARCRDGNILLTGYRRVYNGPNLIPQHYLALYDASGQQKWLRATTDSIFSIEAHKQGLYCAINFSDSLTYMNAGYKVPGDNSVVCKIDAANGSVLWHTEALKRDGKIFPLDNEHLVANGKGGLLIAGNSKKDYLRMGQSYVGNTSSEYGYGYLALIQDSTHVTNFNNKISGTIFNDTNTNCNNNNEQGLEGFGVVAMPGPYYTVTDASGNYNISVDTGSYTVTVVRPTGAHFKDSAICVTSGHNVAFSSSNQAKGGYDFPTVFNECSYLAVNAEQTITYFPTYQIATSVFVHNLTHDTAKNVSLAIKYPLKMVMPMSSNIPWTSFNAVDSTLTFSSLTILPDTLIEIVILEKIQPQPGFGDTQLYYMTVTPLNLCNPADTVSNRYTLVSGIGLDVDKLAKAEDNIIVYPNPTTGKFFVKGMEGARLIEVYSVTGQKVFHQSGNIGRDIEVDISNVPQGMYMLLIKTDNSVINKKVLKR